MLSDLNSGPTQVTACLTRLDGSCLLSVAVLDTIYNLIASLIYKHHA